MTWPDVASSFRLRHHLLFASHHHHCDLWLPQRPSATSRSQPPSILCHSVVSLDWILTSGIPAHQYIASGVLMLPSGDTVGSTHMKLSVTHSLAYDLVLGRDWLFLCRETLPHASFNLSSGIVHPGQQPSGAISHQLSPSSILTRSPAAPSHTTPNSLAMDVDAQFSGNENVFDRPGPSKFMYYSSPCTNTYFTSSWT